MANPAPWRVNRGWALGGGGVLATSALALWAFAAPSPTPSPATLPSLPVQVAPVQPETGSGAATSSYTAILHHDREARLAFRLPGRIAALPVRVGDRLAAGAVVAQLDAVQYAAAVTRAEADYARSARTADRYAGLAQEGAASTAQAHDAADLTRAADAARTAARFDLRDTRLTMPFAGTVIERQAERGEMTSPGQPVLSIADTRSPLLARAQLPADVAVALRPGQPALVRLADGATLEGHVLRKAGAADSRTGLTLLEIVLPKGPAGLSGAPASVQFPFKASASGSNIGPAIQRIPAEALLQVRGSTATVFIIDRSGRARRQTIRFIGLIDRDARVSGLPADARVITLGAGFARDGQPVEVTR